MHRYQYHRIHSHFLKLRFYHVASSSSWSLVNALRASTTDLRHFQQLHSHILRCGHFSDDLISVALVRSYVQAGRFTDAHQVFVEIPQPSVDAWNSLISGYARSGQFCKALDVFLGLESSGEARPNSYSFTAALPACGGLRLLRLGRSVHAKIVKSGFEIVTVVSNCLIDMYGKCGSAEDAMSLFERTVEKDVVSWNSLIGASARNGRLQEAVCFLPKMPNPDTISYNALINGFAVFGEIEDAVKVLSITPNPNSSSWNSIITACCVYRDRAREGLEIFSEMHAESFRIDGFTLSSLLSGIARLSALTWGSLVHCLAIKIGLDFSTAVGSALIDMYSKCGNVTDAESVFQTLEHKNLVTWNAMLSGFAHNGNASRVIELFEHLQTENNIKPDKLTFLSVLSACSHNPMPVEAALEYFNLMVASYGIEPTIDHYCCIIRLMGNIGELGRAKRLIHEAGLEHSALAWKCLLGACGGWRDLKTAEAAAAKVIGLEGNTGYAFNVISNMYASYGKWEKVAEVREIMKETGIARDSSVSWIEIEHN